jgi:hypothetical protein
MVVTYKVSYSNSNDSDEFSWTWNVPDSLNNIFPLCLKMLLHFKKRQVFLAHPVYTYIHYKKWRLFFDLFHTELHDHTLGKSVLITPHLISGGAANN